jgi:hypothetical protein
VGWCTPVIPELGRWWQKDFMFKASMDYIARLCPKTNEQLSDRVLA